MSQWIEVSNSGLHRLCNVLSYKLGREFKQIESNRRLKAKAALVEFNDSLGGFGSGDQSSLDHQSAGADASHAMSNDAAKAAVVVSKNRNRVS